MKLVDSACHWNRWKIVLTAALAAGVALAAQFSAHNNVEAAASAAQTPVHTAQPASPDQVKSGGALFQENCAFCHGRDAGGGASGPDLTRSKLVAADVGGDKIGEVVLNGRPQQGMPHFDFSAPQIASLAAFIHAQRNTAHSGKGARKGVVVADLQTGNAEAGRRYFNGAGGCASCHSPTGDLAGIASRYQGLELEERMLYPKNTKSKVTVTLPSGQVLTGTLAYLDEFTVGMIDPTGTYRSWRTSDVRYTIDAPVNAHIELLSKYTDADIHNLMAYLQTLR